MGLLFACGGLVREQLNLASNTTSPDLMVCIVTGPESRASAIHAIVVAIPPDKGGP
jgi:hypothetical protein